MNAIKNVENSSNKEKCIIIFSGFNQRAIIAFLRTLEKHKVNYAIIAKSQEDDILLTSYKNNVLSIRESVPLVLKDLLTTIEEVHLKKQADEYIIAPTTEALNRFLLEHREEFESRGYKIPLVDKDLYEQISNKHSFGQLCSENEILIPMEINFKSPVVFPIVAKPKEYYSIMTDEILSPVIINNNDELTLFEKSYHYEDFYFQEFIDGRSLYLLYYFSKDGTVYKFSQENLIQQPDGKSMVASISSDFHKESESIKYENLFKNINFFGLVMIEVKQIDRKSYMIEANPRFWGPSQLFVDAGVNLFDAFLYDIDILNFKPKFNESNSTEKYFWLGGVFSTYKRNFELTYHKEDEYYFLATLSDWLGSDIYRRSDSMEVFKKEII